MNAAKLFAARIDFKGGFSARARPAAFRPISISRAFAGPDLAFKSILSKIEGDRT
jgi:hypothetical protein